MFCVFYLYKMDLTTQQNNFKIELKNLEDDLLSCLSAARGNFLGDISLVEHLENTKTTATHIEYKVRLLHYHTNRVLSLLWLHFSPCWFLFSSWFWMSHNTAIASFYCISCKWCVVRNMCNERVLEHDWEPNSSFCAIGTHRWWRPERTRQRSTRLENYTAQQLREHHSSSSSSMTSARLTPCTSFLSRWSLYPWSVFRGLASFCAEFHTILRPRWQNSFNCFFSALLFLINSFGRVAFVQIILNLNQNAVCSVVI